MLWFDTTGLLWLRFKLNYTNNGIIYYFLIDKYVIIYKYFHKKQ